MTSTPASRPPDADDDRTVIRPAASNAPRAAATSVQSAPPVAADADDDRTRIRPSTPAMPAPARVPAAAAVVAPGPGLRPEAGDDDGGGLRVGTRLNEFEITRLVGEGGFGLVYEAHDHSLQRRVALKEYMPSSLATRNAQHQVTVKSARHRDTFEAGLHSFVNEARLLASFDHPSLIKVYRFWEDNGTAYMVMPFLEGVTLKDYLRQLDAPPDEAWLRGLLGPLTEALGVIHAKQCFHRDIAPDNVMRLNETHKWLLLDFGAARRVIGDMTQALTVILKPGYAPVEQYAEIPGLKQGSWTDVYALAASVYFAIIGKTPPPSVGRLLNDTYIPLVQAAAGRYSHGFLAAIDRALAVRPEVRTQDIAALRLDLGLDDAAVAIAAPMPARPGVGQGAGQRGANESERSARTRPGVSSGDARPGATAAPGDPAAPTAGGRSSPAPRRPQADGATVSSTHARGGDDAVPARSKAPVLALAGGAAVVLLAFAAYRALTPPPRPAAPVAAVSPDTPPVAPTTASPSVATTPATPTTGATAPDAASPSATVPAAPPALAAPAPASGFDPMQEFDRVTQAGQPAYGVQAGVAKPVLRIGHDELAFSATAQRDGFLYVFAAGADGALLQLLPNTVSGSIKLKAGQTFRFPGSDGVVLGASDPPGPGRLLVLVSARQRSYAALEPKKEGPFLLFPAGADAAAMLARLPASGRPALAGQPICPASGACDETYGAAVIQVDTVR